MIKTFTLEPGQPLTDEQLGEIRDFKNILFSFLNLRVRLRSYIRLKFLLVALFLCLPA